ncbi:sulfur carrier protein ThiS adenylyltransferase ThiF [Desulfolithobacter sp.]
MLVVNEQPWPYRQDMRMEDLAAEVKPYADVFVLNGKPVGPETLLKDGDRCTLIKKGEIPSALDMDKVLRIRHSPKVQEHLRKATVGVMGLGGLGSAVAVSLVKIGIGKLIICDYDVVDLSNIHRQQYFIDQIGQKKTRALKNTLVRINPFVAVEPLDVQLTEQTITELAGRVDILVECFDQVAMKSAALRVALKCMKNKGFVGASGLAGYGPGNTIRTRRIKNNIYLVGDNESDVATTGSLLAPRVGIAAHQQANQVVRILLGENEV